MDELALGTILSFAFATGLVAAFNPCGFAMLPAYLSYFVSLESDEEAHISKNILRGLIVGLTLTVGFVLFFGVVGILASTIISQGAIQSRLSWATFIIGILMVPLGVAMLFGYEPKLQCVGRHSRVSHLRRGYEPYCDDFDSSHSHGPQRSCHIYETSTTLCEQNLRGIFGAGRRISYSLRVVGDSSFTRQFW